MIDISKLILLAVIFGGLYFLYWLITRKQKGEKLQTTQDVIGKDAKVSEDGIIEVDSVFRVCMYMSQANMRTNTDMEKYMVWLSFRTFLSEVGLSFTLLELSQFVDVREYAGWYNARLEKAKLTQALLEGGNDVVKFIETADEDKNSRDYSGYVIFQYNPSTDFIDHGLNTGNPQIDELIKKISGKKVMSKNERVNLARQILSEAAYITAKYAEQMGMTCWQLNRAQVYDLSFKIIQRDYSSFSSAEEASAAQCFTPYHESLTKRTLQYELGGGANATNIDQEKS